MFKRFSSLLFRSSASGKSFPKWSGHHKFSVAWALITKLKKLKYDIAAQARKAKYLFEIVDRHYAERQIYDISKLMKQIPSIDNFEVLFND